MSDEIVYRYDETRDPAYVAPAEGGTGQFSPSFLVGVPLRDLTRADLSGLAKWQRASIKAAPFFVAVTGEANEVNEDESAEAADQPTSSRRKPRSE